MGTGSAWPISSVLAREGLAPRLTGPNTNSASLASARYLSMPSMMAAGKLAWMRRRVPESERARDACLRSGRRNRGAPADLTAVGRGVGPPLLLPPPWGHEGEGDWGEAPSA
eukprot:5910754-Alexandrium_andersonii.AAC.1